jgi:hypothetical protein
MSRHLLLSFYAFSAIALTACGFDPSSAEFDERRYNELQKADCQQMSSVGSSKLISKEGKDKGEILARCEKMKSLSLEEYKRAAEYARNNDGVWDFDNIPHK